MSIHAECRNPNPLGHSTSLGTRPFTWFRSGVPMSREIGLAIELRQRSAEFLFV